MDKSKIKSIIVKTLKVGAVVAVVGLTAFSAVQSASPVEVPTCPEQETLIINNTEIVEKEVTVDKIVEVDNGKLDYLITSLEDRKVIDDENGIIAVLMAEDVALELAIAEIEDDFADEVEDADIVRDERDAELVYVKSDFEDILIVKSDFEDNEYKFEIEAKIYDDDAEKNKKVIFSVNVFDNEASIKKVELK